MRRYEMMIVLDTDTEESAVEKSNKKIETLIENNQGKLEKTEQLGKKRLAYEINHKKDGIYSLFFFHGEPKTLEELERNLRIQDEIIRFGIFKLPEVKKKG